MLSDFMRVEVLVKALYPDSIIPSKASSGAACVDLTAYSVTEESLGWTVGTGIAVAVPEDHVMLIFPRSGLSTKLGLTLRNSTGVIDSDYRGEIILKFDRGMPAYRDEVIQALRKGQRVAQAAILPVPLVSYVEVYKLPETSRGTGGFGSTGL